MKYKSNYCFIIEDKKNKNNKHLQMNYSKEYNKLPTIAEHSSYTNQILEGLQSQGINVLEIHINSEYKKESTEQRKANYKNGRKTVTVDFMMRYFLSNDFSPNNLQISFDYENIDSALVHYYGGISELWADYWDECNYCPSNDTPIFNINIFDKYNSVNLLISNNDIYENNYVFEDIVCNLGNIFTLENLWWEE